MEKCLCSECKIFNKCVYFLNGNTRTTVINKNEKDDSHFIRKELEKELESELRYIESNQKVKNNLFCPKCKNNKIVFDSIEKEYICNSCGCRFRIYNQNTKE